MIVLMGEFFLIFVGVSWILYGGLFMLRMGSDNVIILESCEWMLLFVVVRVMFIWWCSL